jgi:NADH-quinone oxidoreductase subunit E
VKEELAEVLDSYRGEKGAVIPILQKVQGKLGYLPEEAVKEVARFLRTSESEIYGVITFYAQFRTTPSGKNIVRVCRGTACHVRGGARIRAEVEKQLGVKAGETTPDLEYTLETVACIGACALSPTMVINDQTYGQMTTKKVAEIFGSAQKEG